MPRHPAPRRFLFAVLSGILALFASFGPEAARAAGTFYVDNTKGNANDSGPGTEAIPFRTIQAAVTKQGGPGTTIFVKPGIYSGASLTGKSGAAGSELVVQALGSPVSVTGEFIAAGSAYIRIEGFEIQGRVFLRGGHHITIRANRIIADGGTLDSFHGIQVAMGPDGVTPAYSLLIERNNVFGEEISNAIYFDEGHDSVIQDNVCQGDSLGQAVVRIEDSSRNIFRRNLLHHGGDSGLEMARSDSNEITLNQSWANRDHGIGLVGGNNNVFDSNVSYGNAHDGFSLEGGAKRSRVHNCIFANNGLGAPNFDFYVADSSYVGLVSDDNIIWNSTAQNPVKYRGVQYATVAAYSAASGLDTRTIQANPLFVAPGVGDFRLQAGSPAIDSGNSLDPVWPALDFHKRSRVDDPNKANTGLGSITFADRGAIEFFPGTVSVGDAPGSSLALSAAHPNPSRSAVSFVLSLPRAQRVRWEVLDVQGRRVWQAPASDQAAGQVLLSWSGRDAAGAPAAPGLYLARVSFGGQSAVRSFTLVK